MVCNRLFTSGRESHGRLVTGVKESLVGRARWSVSKCSREEIAIPGRESLVVGLVTGRDGIFDWLFNPGQEGHVFRLVTGLGESHGRRLRAVGGSSANRIDMTE